MNRPKPPLVFRITAALLVAAIVLGGWWQRQPAGLQGRAFLAAVARVCPAAVRPVRRPRIADTARALDHWVYAEAGNLLPGADHDRCRLPTVKR